MTAARKLDHRGDTVPGMPAAKKKPVKAVKTAKAPVKRSAPPVDPTVSRDFTPMNPLARLILRRKSELNMNWRELGARGGFVNHTVLYALATKAEHKQVPRPATIGRIAKALDLPEDVVRMAAAEAAGYHIEDVQVGLGSSSNLRIIAAAMGAMSAADQEKLVRIAEAFAGEQRS